MWQEPGLCPPGGTSRASGLRPRPPRPPHVSSRGRPGRSAWSPAHSGRSFQLSPTVIFLEGGSNALSPLPQHYGPPPKSDVHQPRGARGASLGPGLRPRLRTPSPPRSLAASGSLRGGQRLCLRRSWSPQWDCPDSKMSISFYFHPLQPGLSCHRAAQCCHQRAVGPGCTCATSRPFLVACRGNGKS